LVPGRGAHDPTSLHGAERYLLLDEARLPGFGRAGESDDLGPWLHVHDDIARLPLACDLQCQGLSGGIDRLHSAGDRFLVGDNGRWEYAECSNREYDQWLANHHPHGLPSVRWAFMARPSLPSS